VGVASGVVVALAASTLAVFAVRSQGQTVHDADLNDGGVWVSSTKDGQFARLNKAVGQFDAGLRSPSSPGQSVDVLQDEQAVAGISATGELIPIDTRVGRLNESLSVGIPKPASATNLTVFAPRTVDLHGGTIATVDPRTGKVWGTRVDPGAGITGLDGINAGAKPLATVGPVAAVAVDVEGGIHAVSAAKGTVISIPATTTGFGTPVTERIKLESRAVDITAVGTRWVVYDPEDDQLFVQGRSEVVQPGVAHDEGQPAYAALQQPGPDAGAVGLQDVTSLKVVSLGGFGGPSNGGVEIRDLPTGGQGPQTMVSRPLHLGSCYYAAWAAPAATYYGQNCGSDQPTPAVSIKRTENLTVKDGVALRTNHRLVVLNDLDGGEVWDLDPKHRKLDQWDSLIPPPTKPDQNDKKENLLDEATAAQPPKAKDDNLKVRPGRTSKLYVLDNDTDSSDSILSIDPGDVSGIDLSGVSASVSSDGQSIDVKVPADPERQSFSFKYKVNNGKAPEKSQATVRVTLVPDEVNTPPHLRPGPAKLANKVYPVNQGKVLPVQVVGDWRDPESDPLTVEPAQAGSYVDGLGRLDVRAPMKRGTVPLEYSVSDGRDSTTGRVSLNVLGPDDKVVKPQTQPDVVRGVVGKPIQVEPLGNDIPGADPTEPDARMRLAREITDNGSLHVDTNLDTGVVTITGAAQGTFELSYGAQVGGGIDSGRVRVDLIADPDPDAPPVAVPDTASLRDQSPVLVDALANDYSPRADVLVTRSVSVSSDNDWLRPSIYQGRWVRIEALDPSTDGARPRQGVVQYTISDGSKTSTGEIDVSQFPPDNTSVPVVQDDTAVVRAQDSVTIPVTDNDSMANGIPLVLDPKSVAVVGDGSGADAAFASGNVVRFVPADRNPKVEETRTVEYAVYPVGMPAKARTGRVTITVTPLPTAQTPNQPPTARSFSSSVVAGEPLTITVPTSGVDPDGDSVTVDGIVGTDGEAVDLSLGRVTSFGSSTIKYEAYPDSAGTEVLNYTVRDRFGATSSGFVRIGVVQPGDPQPPVAVEDVVKAAPGKRVTVDATQNDLIARGDSVRLEYKDINDAETLKAWKVDEPNTYFSTRVHAVSEGVQHIAYGINDGLFDPSTASVSVIPVDGWKNPPVAVDDTAKPKHGETTTLVDVTANDRDIDGDRSELKVTRLLSPEGTIEGNQVRVKVLDHPHTVPYVITDGDGEQAMALIHVPTGDNGAPYVTGKVIEMDKDSTKSVKLADYVTSPRARVVSITTAENVSASPSDKLTAEADGRAGLTLTSSGGYVGPAAVMLEVSDQETLEQKDFGTAYVSIPVQVGPKVPLLRCPDFAITVNAAGLPRDIDIPTLCHAWVPIGMTLDDAAFDVSWDPESKGTKLSTSGPGNRLVTVRADEDAPTSTNGRIKIGVRGGVQPPSYVRVTVIGLADKGAQAAAQGGNSLPQMAMPRMRPFTVSGLKAGSSQTVNLRSYLDSPLAKPDCTITAAAPAPGSGLSTSYSGCNLTVSAGPEAKGTSSVSVTVSDHPGRNAAGRGTVDILGHPGKPAGVSAEADRVNGGTARVNWTPPAYDGGSPITSYTVRWSGGSQRCYASPCTIGGLTNGQSYTFRVLATNGVGDGPPSDPSNAVKPDTKPNPVSGVHLVRRGDGSLVAGWSRPAKKGSDITQYNVRATDTTNGNIRQATVAASQLQATISGLTNNHSQNVRVRARNGAGWGNFGPAVRMQSAGTPPAVPRPTLNPRGPGAARSSEALKISWPAVSPNGPALVRYTIYRKIGSGGWSARKTTSPGTRTWTDTVPYDGRTYTYTVTATNGAGKQSPRSNTASFRSVGIPATPGRPSVSTPNPNYSAVVRVRLGDSRSGGFTKLQWQNSRGRTGTVSCGCPEGTVKQFTIGSLGTTSQTLKVRAYNGRSWSAWSSSSNSYQAYGPTKAPTGLRSAVVSGDNVRWTWSLPTNGRSIDKVQVRGSWSGTYGRITSFERDGSPGGSYRLSVRAHSAAGWSGWTAYASRSIPEPVPSVTVRNPGKHRTGGSCDNYASCYEIQWSIKNFKPGNYTYTCQSSAYGNFYSGSMTVTGPNSYTKSGWCVVDTRNNSWAGITLSGGPSGTHGDKNYNW
jgi:hypothetical protein